MDSTVCTALLNRALNRDQVIAVHIDNGFMRKRESQSVEEALKKLGIQVKGTIISLNILDTTNDVSHLLKCTFRILFHQFESPFMVHRLRTKARVFIWNNLGYQKFQT